MTGALIRSLELDARTRDALLAANALDWLGREARELDVA